MVDTGWGRYPSQAHRGIPSSTSRWCLIKHIVGRDTSTPVSWALLHTPYTKLATSPYFPHAWSPSEHRQCLDFTSPSPPSVISFLLLKHRSTYCTCSFLSEGRRHGSILANPPQPCGCWQGHFPHQRVLCHERRRRRPALENNGEWDGETVGERRISSPDGAEWAPHPHVQGHMGALSSSALPRQCRLPHNYHGDPRTL